MNVDLRKKPYELNDEQVDWVEKQLARMSDEDKLKQLFTILTASKEESYLQEVCEEYRFGGVRYNPGSAEEISKHNRFIQDHCAIPVLIAANCESGGNGACKEGTDVGVGTKIGATKDLSLAYQMGYIAALEAKQVGVNTLFAPIVDIHHDFHNPIIAYKTFGNDFKQVREMSVQFLKGVQDNQLLACAKHFPGDGYDERDQHLSPSINPLSRSKWDQSFGKVYRALIDEGLPMIMAGHIQFPSYQKYFAPDCKEYLPATVCKELLTDLLRNQLGFNGVITSDATHMVALTCCMKRSELLPRMIAAGCDMILFYNDFDEDFSFMKKGLEDGIITKERLEDANRRILGLKAKLELYKRLPEGDLSLIGCVNHKNIAREVSVKGITLVKEEPGLLPIRKESIHRILIVPQQDENPFASLMPKMPTIFDYLKDKLSQEGFEVEIFESLMDKAKKASPQEAFKMIQNVYNNKTPVSLLTNRYDLIIHVCDFDSHNTVSRISWKMSKGTPDIPWYVNEVKTMMISLRNPFHLFDAPQVKTYINCYDKNKSTIDVLVDKLTGKDRFYGVSPIDAFCGMKK